MGDIRDADSTRLIGRGGKEGDHAVFLPFPQLFLVLLENSEDASYIALQNSSDLTSVAILWPLV